MPKISVIVPVYNGISYIKDCLNSIVNQTLKDIEIIVVNDGSIDGTREVLEEYELKYKNIRVINQENHGLYFSRKKGLSLANGDYIGWVDADDFIDIKMYEILYEEAIKNKSELVYCNYSCFPKPVVTKAKWFREYRGKVDVDFVERNSQPWNKIVSRQLLEKLGIGDLFISCFDEAYIKVLVNANNPVSINRKMYFYRISSSSMSFSYTNVNHYERFVMASEKLEKEMGSDNSYWNDYFKYRVIYYLLLTMLVAANADDKKSYEISREKLRGLDLRNIHLVPVLNRNFGIIKSFAIRKCVPFNFSMAKIMSFFAFRIIK